MDPSVQPEHPHATRSNRGAPLGLEGQGRFDRGLELLSQSWELLNEHRRLLILPLVSAAITTLATLAIFVPVAVLTNDAVGYKLGLAIGAAASAIPFIFIATYLNVAFLGMAQDHIDGREPSVRRGLALARSRVRAIAAWTLVSATVGGILAALRALPFDGSELVARIVGLIGGIAWALATFFVVPVLALHDDGARGSIRRSAGVFRKRWGETLTGDVGIGLVFGIALIPAIGLGCAGVFSLEEGSTTSGIVLLAVAVALSVPIMAVQSALTELFSLVLYREATDGIVVAPFTEVEIRRSFERKKPLRERMRRWLS